MYDLKDSRVTTNLRQRVRSDGKKSVVLTFDDGPSKYLLEILDILKCENVPAMFFWQSRLLYEKRPWERVLSDGHIIGSHSTKHRNLITMSYQEQLEDIKNSISWIEQITKQKITYFRPPFGQYNDQTIEACQQLGLEIIMWELSSFDWELKDNKQQIVENVINHLRDGAIILLHEQIQTLQVLTKLIHEIKKCGYEFNIL